MEKGLSGAAFVPAILIALLVMLFSPASQAQEPYIGEIRMFAGVYCPNNWLEADGRILPVNQYTELFALFGGIYGGDGRTNFALPDLRGRVPVGQGSAPGLHNYRQGERGGQESVTLTERQMPEHSHAIQGGEGTGKNKAQLALGAQEGGEVLTEPVQNRGGTSAHENRPPYQVIRFCIAVKGNFPPHQ